MNTVGWILALVGFGLLEVMLWILAPWQTAVGINAGILFLVGTILLLDY